MDGFPTLREVRSEAPKCVPKGAQRGPGATKGAQESSQRGPKGCLGPPRRSIVAPGPPKTAAKSRSIETPRASEKSPSPPKGGKVNSNHYLLYLRHFVNPEKQAFWSTLETQNRCKNRVSKPTSPKVMEKRCQGMLREGALGAPREQRRSAREPLRAPEAEEDMSRES